jgi:hypothetical protein
MLTLHSVMFALAAASFAVAYLTLKIKELPIRAPHVQEHSRNRKRHYR